MMYLSLKRLIDLASCSIALALLLPLFAVIALAIKIDSKGPVFYLGRRTGLHGIPFRIIKFRTMVEGAESLGGGTTALNDQRVTRLGRWLRRLKLDELPQVFNVLKNDMSLVGPRPELPRYTALYNEEEAIILSVKPGITDFSSIEFAALDEFVGETDADRVFEDKILPRKNRLRIEYVRRRGFVTDMQVLARTVVRVLGKLSTSSR